MKKQIQHPKKDRNMATNPIPKSIKPMLTAVNEFISKLVNNVTDINKSSKDELLQAVEDHQDDLVKIIKDNTPSQKGLSVKKVKDL